MRRSEKVDPALLVPLAALAKEYVFSVSTLVEQACAFRNLDYGRVSPGEGLKAWRAGRQWFTTRIFLEEYIRNNAQRHGPHYIMRDHTPKRTGPLPKDSDVRLNPRDLKTVAELAQAHGYNPDYFGQQARSGRLRAWRIGTVWVSTDDLMEQFLKSSSGPGRPTKAGVKRPAIDRTDRLKKGKLWLEKMERGRWSKDQTNLPKQASTDETKTCPICGKRKFNTNKGAFDRCFDCRNEGR